MISIDDELSDYIKNKNYKAVNITNIVNLKTYSKYVNLAIKQSDKVFFFKRTTANTLIFAALHATKECNYFFLNKDNYLFTYINKSLSDDNKRCINGFLDTPTDLVECMVCLRKSDQLYCCSKCYYKICMSCVGNILVHNDEAKMVNNRVDLGKCPQCRQNMDNDN